MTRTGKLLAGAGIALGGFVLLACGAAGPTIAASSAPEPAPVATTAAPTQAADSRTDKGWTIVSLNLKDDGTGDFGGTARVRNDNAGTMSGTFTLTVMKGGDTIGSMQGASQGVRAGQTVTVEWVSQDKYMSGSGLTTTFQCDVSF